MEHIKETQVEGGAEFKYGNWADLRIRIVRNSGNMVLFIWTLCSSARFWCLDPVSRFEILQWVPNSLILACCCQHLLTFFKA